MSETTRDRFDLSEFVLGYLEEQGSVVTPPAFGVYDVLMPNELAARLALDEYARLAFLPTNDNESQDEALRLSVNHRLVEAIAQAITRQPANARASISGVRLDKRGLADLARKISLPNARVDALPKTQEEGLQHHYLLCNFKVTFVSEEKQEDLVAVVMDVQAGHIVSDPAILQRLEVIDSEPEATELPTAPPRWIGADSTLSPATLQALLPRTERALRQTLAGQVATLTARMERHLALDLARIGDYYDEMAADLQKRQGRLGEEDAERRQGFADKMMLIETERAAKLEDVRSRYGIRVEMELVNVLLVGQAKVVLPVAISNRTATIRRTVVWDPLVHRLEPLVCDVCGLPGEGLHLCTGGHLAHVACLAPQCVDCKRVFCQLCAAQIGECVVCHRPVCQPSLITCATCGRGTCHEHQQLCHAADGQPATLPEPTAPPSAAKLPPTPPPSAVTKPPPKTIPKLGVNLATGRTKAKPPPLPLASSVPIVKGVRIEVEIHETEPTVVAFVFRSTSRFLATRSFRLTPQGILIHCQCEKEPCPANGYYHRPALPAAISEQLETHLRKLQTEYLIPAKKVKYYLINGNQINEVKRLLLPPFWSDPTRVAEATRGFDEYARR